MNKTEFFENLDVESQLVLEKGNIKLENTLFHRKYERILFGALLFQFTV